MSRSSTLALNPTGNIEPWRVAQAMNQALRGKLNNVDDVTLRANQATTTLVDANIGPQSCILFMPQTANAAAIITSLYVTARQQGQATINHTDNANSDKTFTYAVLG